MRSGGEIAYVAVGANLGDREATFAAVVEAIDREPDLLLRAASPIFETAPVGPADQPAYLNAVLELRSWLAPLELLRSLQAIEARLGRDRRRERQRWGPRPIDLDLLFFGDRCIELPDLTVPHPRAHERAFVLAPMVEIAPRFRHPVLGVELVELARGLTGAGAVRARPRPRGWPGGAPADPGAR